MALVAVSIADQDVMADAAATAEVYAGLPTGLSCTCANCANVWMQRGKLFTPEVCRVFNSLGIDSEKECDVTDYGGSGAGRFIEMLYPFIGRLIEPETPDGSVRVFQIGPSVSGSIYLWGPPTSKPFDRPDSLRLSLQFADVPWVLGEREPD